MTEVSKVSKKDSNEVRKYKIVKRGEGKQKTGRGGKLQTHWVRLWTACGSELQTQQVRVNLINKNLKN